jgi:predicted PurR-regulated permease PerM
MTSRRFDDRQVLLWITIAVFTGGLLYLLAPILSPFLFAAILAYICNPLVERMAKRKLPRSFAAAAVLVLLAALTALLLVILLPLVVRQVRAVIGQIPAYLEWARTIFEPWASRNFGVQLDIEVVRQWLLEHVAEIQKLAVKLLPSLGTGGLALVEFALNLVLVPVVLFYLLRDWDKLMRQIELMIPRRWHAGATKIFRDIDCVLGEFLRGQLLVMLLMGLFYIVTLWAVGLEYALAVGLIAGLLTFIPFVGVITGIVLATLTGLLQFDSYTPIFWIWAIFFAANMVEGYVFVPFLVGDRIGLHPVAVIFALLAFGQLFGFFGVLLALPASAALLVYLRHLRGRYLGSGVYNAPAG